MADDGEFDANGRRLTRWRGVVAVSLGRLWKRATRTRSGRFLATIGAVSLTIALLIVVTGIALSLADGSAVDDTDADVRVEPEESGTLSTIDGVEEPRLGETNDRAESIRSREGVDHASPVLTEPVRFESADGEPRTILLVGVVPDDDSRTVGGLSTDALGSEPAVGRSGEVVLSTVAADRLGADAGDDLAVAGAHPSADGPAPSVTVAAVEDGGDDATPVALVHLHALQTVSGADDGQLADQVLVWGEPDAATDAAEDGYPDAAIESTDRAEPSTLFDDGLAFATSLLALVVGVTICASFVATTAAMTVDDDRRMLAVLASVGFPASSRLAMVAASTLFTTLCGALVGVGLGILGIHAVDAVASATVAPGTVAQFHPVFVPYAVVVALLAGLVAVPYPLAVAARTSVLEEVGR